MTVSTIQGFNASRHPGFVLERRVDRADRGADETDQHADEACRGVGGTLLHGSAAVAGQGSIGAGWNPANNRKPRGAVQTPRRASSSYPKTALSGHERAGI